MSDERMSAHEVAVLTRDEGLGLLTGMERRLLGALRHERERAKALEAERDRLLFDSGRVLGNIAAKAEEAAKRERKACAAYVRRRGIECGDGGMAFDVLTDVANEIEEGLHRG